MTYGYDDIIKAYGSVGLIVEFCMRGPNRLLFILTKPGMICLVSGTHPRCSQPNKFGAAVMPALQTFGGLIGSEP